MKLTTIGPGTRLFAAGLCGAAVLAFTALDVQQAKAQDEEPVTEGSQTQKDMTPDNTEHTNTTTETTKKKMTSRIQLDNVQFDARVVKTVGSSALIVQADERELLVPSSLAKHSAASEQTMKDDKMVSQKDSAEIEATDEKDTALKTEPETVDEGEIVAEEAPLDEKVASVDKSEFQTGDTVTVELNDIDAELVALENDVLTVRTSDSVMQLPAGILPNDLTSQIQFSATIDGEKRPMTLKEALDNDRELTLSQDWPQKLAKDAEVGVIVASEPERLLLATVSGDSVQIVQIPQSMRAGEAVALNQKTGGEVDLEPLDAEGSKFSFQRTELKGTLVSQTGDLVVLEQGKHNLVLPAGLELKSNNGEPVKAGSSVTAVMPAGEAEILAQLDDNRVVLETKDGVAQLPMDALKKNVVMEETPATE